MTARTAVVARHARVNWAMPAQAVAPRRLILSAAACGAVAATLGVAQSPGVGAALTMVAVVAAVWPATRGRRTASLIGWGSASLALGLVVVWRDAPWLVTVDLVAAVGLGSVALVGPRTFAAHAAAGTALVLAAYRGRSWMTGGARGALGRPETNVRPWIRATAVSVPLLAIFAALFAKADAVFGHLLRALTPHVQLSEAPSRLVGFAIAATTVLASGYLMATRPRFDTLLGATRLRPTRVEWLMPLVGVDLVVGAFVAVQLRTWMGGDGFVRQTAGLTYATYARTGFAQLVVASVLTVAVIALAVRWAPRENPLDGLLLKGVLGTLCVLTLVVLATAAHRLALYDAAFGITELRLAVAFSIGWIAAVFVLILLAGAVSTAGWLPRAVVVSMVVALGGLTAVNPDAVVANSLVDRYYATHVIDAAYLSSLSADAVPAVLRLPPAVRNCVAEEIAQRRQRPDGFAGWNAANVSWSRAEQALKNAGLPQRSDLASSPPPCAGVLASR